MHGATMRFIQEQVKCLTIIKTVNRSSDKGRDFFVKLFSFADVVSVEQLNTCICYGIYR